MLLCELLTFFLGHCPPGLKIAEEKRSLEKQKIRKEKEKEGKSVRTTCFR